MRTTIAAAVLVLAGPLTLGGCGGDEDGGGATTSPTGTPSTPGALPSATGEAAGEAAHNSADVDYVKTMLPHLDRGRRMARAATTRSAGPVQEIAQGIQARLATDVGLMQGWLEAWGEEVPDLDADVDLKGSITEDELAEVEAAGPEGFGEKWLESMLEHHEASLQLSEVILQNGQNPGVLDLAQKVVETHETEIGEMQRTLEELAGSARGT